MIRKIALLAATALGTYAAPAAAAEPTTCASYTATIINGWTSCAGFYDGNIFSNNTGDVAKQMAAVAALGGSYNGNFNGLYGFGSLGNNSSGARTIDLGKTFFGPTIIGMHFGNIGAPQDQYGNVSVFYKFNFGSGGARTLTFVESRGLSNLYVFNATPAVPEPGTWAMMILGFGAVGAAMRRKRQTARVSFA